MEREGGYAGRELAEREAKRKVESWKQTYIDNESESDMKTPRLNEGEREGERDQGSQ